jgi:hypothetical protein
MRRRSHDRLLVKDQRTTKRPPSLLVGERLISRLILDASIETDRYHGGNISFSVAASEHDPADMYGRGPKESNPSSTFCWFMDRASGLVRFGEERTISI